MREALRIELRQEFVDKIESLEAQLIASKGSFDEYRLTLQVTHSGSESESLNPPWPLARSLAALCVCLLGLLSPCSLRTCVCLCDSAALLSRDRLCCACRPG